MIAGAIASTLRALLPIGLGHAASIALVAGAVVFGLSLDRTAMQVVAGGLLLGAAALHLRHRAARRGRVPAGRIALALSSFMVSTAHGAGLMLVPALMPLCLAHASTRPVTGTGPLLLALAAIGAHGAAMLAVTGVVFFSADVAFRRRIPLSWMRTR